MAFIIESLANQPMISLKVQESLSKTDGLCIKMSLSQLLAARKKNTTLYLALNFTELNTEAELPLVTFFSQFAEVYHQWRKDFQLEVLLLIDPVLMPAVRYLSDSLCLPMLYFASYEARTAYLNKCTGDTQPFRPEWAKNLAKPQRNEE